jgi:hypothetical protein
LRLSKLVSICAQIASSDRLLSRNIASFSYFIWTFNFSNFFI